jgi:hypothetical protein
MNGGQRYCLECGARRAHLGGMREGLQVSASSRGAAAPAAPSSPAAAPYAPAGVGPHDVAAIPPPGSGATAVIAGVGVLLLAMGIGVLIGRSGSGKTAAAPQVISVAQPGTGTAGATGAGSGAATTPITSTPTHTAAPRQSKPSATGVGAVPSKPAPPSAIQNLRTGGSGQSYEQKSKNLPNVVSTG